MEINLKYKNKSLYIATPMFGGKCDFTYSYSMNKLCSSLTAAGISFEVDIIANESMIQRARNYLVDNFIRSDFTHFLFIDSDIGFDPDHVFHMLGMMSEDSGYDVLAGAYPMKGINWETISNAVEQKIPPNRLSEYMSSFAFNLGSDNKSELDGSPINVLETGTGFMMISRETFEKFQEIHNHYYKPNHKSSKNFNGDREIGVYFHCDFDENNELLSEDFYFCRKVNEAGMNVWVLPWINLTHCGAFIFTGSLIKDKDLNVRIEKEDIKNEE